MVNLVFIKKNEVVTDSLMVAERFNKEHNHVLRDIEIQINKLKEAGETEFSQSNFGLSNYINRGKEYKKYNLTDKAFAMVAMSYTTPEAMKMKVKFLEEFERMRSALIELQSTEWKETRIKGKLTRRNEMDVIAQYLIPLAIEQGSKNPEKYYLQFSKMVNKLVGIPSNSREIATQRTLDAITALERLIEQTIIEQSQQGIYYKTIYKNCKNKCETLVELLYLPEQRLLLQ